MWLPKIIRNYLCNQHERDTWVITKLKEIHKGFKILDAGCGSQRYRKFCSHLEYFGHDFAQYDIDKTKSLTSTDAKSYEYGDLDYVSDVWDIDAKNASFDVILCTEVFEHIPYPNRTIQEFSRLLKKGGSLILTAPNACLRHMDPYFYYSGFSDNYFKSILTKHGFCLEEITTSGNYYHWLAVELARSFAVDSSYWRWFFSPFMLITFLFYVIKSIKPNHLATSTLCFGYFVLAKKK